MTTLTPEVLANAYSDVVNLQAVINGATNDTVSLRDGTVVQTLRGLLSALELGLLSATVGEIDTQFTSKMYIKTGVPFTAPLSVPSRGIVFYNQRAYANRSSGSLTIQPNGSGNGVTGNSIIASGFIDLIQELSSIESQIVNTNTATNNTLSQNISTVNAAIAALSNTVTQNNTNQTSALSTAQTTLNNAISNLSNALAIDLAAINTSISNLQSTLQSSITSNTVGKTEIKRVTSNYRPANSEHIFMDTTNQNVVCYLPTIANYAIYEHVNNSSGRLAIIRPSQAPQIIRNFSSGEDEVRLAAGEKLIVFNSDGNSTFTYIKEGRKVLENELPTIEQQTNTVSTSNGKKVLLLSSSLGSGTAVIKGKSYAKRLNELLDGWVVINNSKSGDDIQRSIEALRTNTGRFGRDNIVDLGTEYCMILHTTNDQRVRDQSDDYFIEIFQEFIDLLQLHGITPIVFTEAITHRYAITAKLADIAAKAGGTLIDLTSATRIFHLNRDVDKFDGAHNGTDTSYIYTWQIYDYLRRNLPECDRGVKVFRSRSATNSNLLRFSNNKERLQKWVEIDNGHDHLADSIRYKIDDLNGALAVNETACEYGKLDRGEAVNLGIRGLIDITIPCEPNTIESLTLNLPNFTGAVSFMVPRNGYVDTERYIGFRTTTEPTAGTGDVYTTDFGDQVTVEAVVFDNYGEWIVITNYVSGDYVSGSKQVAGTLTRVSGTGENEITYSRADWALDPDFYTTLGQEDYVYETISVNNGQIQFSLEEIKTIAKGNRIIGVLSNSNDDIIINGVSVIGVWESRTKVREKAVRRNLNFVGEFITNNDPTDAANWVRSGATIKTLTVEKPKGVTDDVIVVGQNKSITNTGISFLDHEFITSQGVIRLWARRDKPKFTYTNDTNGPAEYDASTSVTKYATYDYETIYLKIFRSNLPEEFAVFKQLVGPDWQYVDFELPVFIDDVMQGINFGIEIYASADVEIAKIYGYNGRYS